MVTIKELIVGEINYNKILYATIITPIDKLLSARVLIEDINTDIIELNIYNLIPFSVDISNAHSLQILSPNTATALLLQTFCKI